jgi:hypothetical protein
VLFQHSFESLLLIFGEGRGERWGVKVDEGEEELGNGVQDGGTHISKPKLSFPGALSAGGPLEGRGFEFSSGGSRSDWEKRGRCWEGWGGMW